jgi:dinuclear metal center YbgI/SA1388 family protein
MTATVQNILDILDTEAPFSLAESWDNVGLLVGNPQQLVTGVLAGLDPTNNLVNEAVERGCNVIITHHPVIFKPLTAINTGVPEGKLLEKALSNQIAIIGCHTNFDSAEEGVSDYLGQQLGVSNMIPLLTHSETSETTGIGRIGKLPGPVSAKEFLGRVLTSLNLPGVQLTGKLPEKIQTVAICGGSGSDLAPIAFKRGADVYISAEIKHATAIWANENNFCIIDGTHYATEKPAVSLLVKKLQQSNDNAGWEIPMLQSEQEIHPFVFMDKNSKP